MEISSYYEFGIGASSGWLKNAGTTATLRRCRPAPLSRANRSAISRPSPCDAPVIRIFLPASLLMRLNVGSQITRTKDTTDTKEGRDHFLCAVCSLSAGLLFFRKLDSRFLHFAVRKKPNKRFIVKIDNLD